MTAEQDQVLFRGLNYKLAETQRQVSEHERLAAYHTAEAARFQALANNIQETIKGLFGEDMGLPRTPLVKNGVFLNGSTVETSVSIANQDEEDDEALEFDESSPEFIDVRSPKEMQRSEYRGMSYIETAIKAVSHFPNGLTLDQFVKIIFDCQNEKEFSKAKGSFAAEIRRAVEEERLEIAPETRGKKQKLYLLPQANKSTVKEVSFPFKSDVIKKDEV